jgi:regulator of replication initiation timing
MTRKDSQDSLDIDLFGGLLQKYEDASANVQSHKTVIKAYENIGDVASAAKVVKNRRDLLLIAFEQLTSIGEKALAEFTMKVQELKGLNRILIEENTRLHSDFERLKLEYQRQIGVLPKAMNSNKKGKNKKDSLTEVSRNCFMALSSIMWLQTN